ncbi:MAG: hypothetical protein IH591_14175, partial [Bacteroidales bacterium]|nr:hypothetical protein [Bacteroidales bacterium]
MKPRLLISLLAIIVSSVLHGQYPLRSWIDNYSYNNGSIVVAGNNKIFCCTSSGIITADTEYNSVSRISTVNGLTETGLSTIGWSEENSTLIIAYASTNIDLLTGNEVVNIPEVMRKSIPGLKEIYRIRTMENFAYLACSFGIVIVDLSKKEIHDTWKPGTGTDLNPVFDITFNDGKVFAATASGIYEGSLSSQGLAFFGNWSRHEGLPSPSASYNCIAAAGNRVFANKPSSVSGDSVFMFNGAWQFIYKTDGASNKTFEKTSLNELIVSSVSDVRILNQSGSLLRTVDEYLSVDATPSNAIKTGNTLWIADAVHGLVSVDASGSASQYLPDGPQYNSVANIVAANGKIYTAGGAVDNAWNNTWKMLEVSFREDGRWTSLPVSIFRDAMRVIPGKENNYFVSTWGMGLLEYSGTTLLNHYNEYNSPLSSIIPGQRYTRLCGMAFDSEDNLWIVHSGVTENIKILKPDRTWVTLPVTIEAPTIGDIIIAKSGLKWIVLPRGYGLFIIDDNKTPYQPGDDIYRKIVVRDTDDKIISNVYSVTEDLDGNIWVGTDQGPAIYYNPDRITSEDIKAVRIKIPRNDGTGLADYMLGTEIITSIAIDGANRKWIGTFNSGAYLLSADGTKKVTHFTADNSPLPSNTIVSVSSDLSTGLIWFGTPDGIISFRGDAPAGNDQFSNVYAFPNPVRPDYEGPLTIAGLVRDSNVKITDISGNLVFETTSTGGEATWDLLNYRGERV